MSTAFICFFIITNINICVSKKIFSHVPPIMLRRTESGKVLQEIRFLPRTLALSLLMCTRHSLLLRTHFYVLTFTYSCLFLYCNSTYLHIWRLNNTVNYIYCIYIIIKKQAYNASEQQQTTSCAGAGGGRSAIIRVSYRAA